MTGRPSRTAALCVAALAAAVLGGCSTDHHHRSTPSPSGPTVSAAPGPGGPTASPSASRKPTASPSPSATGYDNPQSVATAYVGAFVEQKWSDSGPRAYLDRIAPYATAAFVKKLRDGTGDRCDLACRGAKKRHVTVSADNIRTVIPEEAPRTPTKVWVQVTYMEHTSWDDGGDSAASAMNLELVKDQGKWLVDARMGAG
ncbi:hypothetical protein [Streptomyces alanosinicus]|uniref:Lipoprotein n=1 Tax=Streptomyces alanosinicus TaxID=68171 RepID=A0A918YLR6_9ACTN|nr:hypothetical protein [Streptomyces alanosinicus]GHE07330.1 hypothetical protein GCM10010339_51990 [Streptomyces alanosinicus]